MFSHSSYPTYSEQLCSFLLEHAVGKIDAHTLGLVSRSLPQDAVAVRLLQLRWGQSGDHRNMVLNVCIPQSAFASTCCPVLEEVNAAPAESSNPFGLF